MRNISELIADIMLKDEDYENIEPIPFDDEMYTKIVENTLKGIEEIKGQDKKCVPKKKCMRVLFIAATLALSTTLLSAAKIIDIRQIFSDTFKENSVNIGSSGQVINTSMTTQGVELNVEGVVSGENAIDLIFNIRKTSGEPFIGEMIEFEEFTVGMENVNYSLARGIVKSDRCEEITPIHPESNERRFHLTTTTIDTIKNGIALLQLKNLKEIEKSTLVSDLNLGTWLREHPQDITLIDNNDIRLELITNQETIAELNIPKQIMTSSDINLQLFKEDEDIKVSSIAFLDHKLHMKVDKTKSKTLHFKDVQGNLFEPIYINDFGSSVYYIFDINNLDELENLTAYQNIETVVNEINGTWEVEFDLDRQNEEIILNPNLIVPLSSEGNLVVKEVQVSNTSLTLISNNFVSHDIRNISIDIHFKDNSSLHLEGAGVSATAKKNKTYIYKFDKPINISAIDTMSINGERIIVQ